MRELKYSEALGEATLQALERDPRLFLIGEGIDDPKGAFGTTLPAYQRFGPERVMDSPLSENAVTGIGIGAAIAGNPCLMIHMRTEFLLLAMDQIVNHAAKWHYMFGGQLNVPIVIRCIVGRGWGQAAQHSQSFHAMYAHVPGLKVILPATAYDAKGLLMAALRDPNPVICIEHRWLYDKKSHVPDEAYEVPIGKAHVIAPGKDLTCAAISYQVHEALAAREVLLKEGIEMEVIDLRSVAPLDKETIFHSVRKTGRLIVTDIAHTLFGVSAEIAATVTESCFDDLKAPVQRIALPHYPTPCSATLEQAYYPSIDDIAQTARNLVSRGSQVVSKEILGSLDRSHPDFTGPF